MSNKYYLGARRRDKQKPDSRERDEDGSTVLPRILALEKNSFGGVIKKREHWRPPVNSHLQRTPASNVSDDFHLWLDTEDIIPMDVHTAASLGDQEAVRSAYKRFEDISQPGQISGWTPLMHAVARNHGATVSALLDLRVNVSTTSRDDGRTALAIAASYADSNVVRRLALETIQQHGAAALLAAAVYDESGNNLPWAKKFPTADEITSQHCKQRLGLDVKDIHGWTPLMHAAAMGRTNSATELLRLGANPNVGDIINMTGLMLAVQGGHTNMVSLLIRHGASVVMQTTTGMTAALFATHGDIKTLKALLDGFDAPSVCKNGCDVQALVVMLGTLGLHKYLPNFLQRNITFSKFLKLTENDLRDMGIVPVGPRKKILLAIEQGRCIEEQRCIEKQKQGQVKLGES